MTAAICPNCKTALGDGWCVACDAESDRQAGRMPAAPIAKTGASVADVLGYLYTEAGIRARMPGATKEERLAHIAVRQDIRELAERLANRG